QQWRDTPELAAVLPELLALTALPKQPGKNARQNEVYRAARPVWQQPVLAAAWHHAARTDPTQPGEHAHPGPEHAPARAVARIADVLTARGAPGGPAYNKQGVTVTSTLVQAFLDQTLHAAETTPGLTPDQITGVHTAYTIALNAVAKLGHNSNADRNFPAMWADPVSRFVTDVDAGAGPQVWTALHNRLAEQAAPVHDEQSVTSHPPRISKELRRAVAQRLTQAGIGAKEAPRSELSRYWPAKTAAAGETSSPASVDWAGQWRDTPVLASVLPELLALVTLPKKPRKTAGQALTATDRHAASREAWGRTVLAAVWHHARPAAPTQPGEHAHADPEHAPARTAERAATILAPRGAAGQRHYPQGIAVTSTLVHVLLDQILHTAETPAPGLTPDQVTAVRTAYQTARNDAFKLGHTGNANRDSPAMWADLVSKFVTDITTSAGPQIWTALHNRLTEPAVPGTAPARTTPATQVLSHTGTREHTEPTAQAVATAPLQATTSTGTTRGVKRKRAQEPGWDEDAQARWIISTSGLELRSREYARQNLDRWSGKRAEAGDPLWVPWRARWAAEGTFASVLTLALLPWPAPGLPDHPRLSELHHEHGRIALATLWRNLEATAEDQAGHADRTDPAALARRTAVEITEIAPASGKNLSYGRIGYLPTGGLARAFVEHTLASVQAAPGLAPDLVEHVRRAHDATLAEITDLFGRRDRTSKTRWAEQLTTFVTAVDTTAGPTVWTTLHSWLQHTRPPQQPAPATPGTASPVPAAAAATVGHLTQPAPQNPARHNTLSDTQDARQQHPDPASWPITQEERQQTLKVLGSAGEEVYGAPRRRLDRYSEKAGGVTPESVGWGGMVALPAWRNSPHLSDMLPTAVALSVLTWSAPGKPDPFAEARQKWGRDVLHALWQHLETTTVDATTEDPGPLSGPAHDRNLAAQIATQVAAAITTQAPSVDGQYHKSGAAATTALARAFIDQTLHAAHAAGPDLIPPDQLARIQDAHQTTWAGLTPLAAPRATRPPVGVWSALIT
ncbi:MAG TPA: hypothetical protein VFP72_00960, partial [Kineosporiaceae bacterium]|nr:hypothetical protein [Kineosporiaceae bacterium]